MNADPIISCLACGNCEETEETEDEQKRRTPLPLLLPFFCYHHVEGFPNRAKCARFVIPGWSLRHE